jgi:putative membrane protein
VNQTTIWKRAVDALLIGLVVSLGACKNDSSPPASTPLPPAPAQTANQPMAGKDMSAEERGTAERILTTIHQVNALEIEAAKVAKTRTRTDDVKDFADTLADNHKDADDKVIGFARDHNLSLAAAGVTADKVGKQTLSEDARKTLADLNRAKPRDFDRTFLTKMVDGHEKALQTLKSSDSQIHADELKSLVNGVESTIQKHLDKARDLQSRLHSAAGAAARTQGRRTAGR